MSNMNWLAAVMVAAVLALAVPLQADKVTPDQSSAMLIRSDSLIGTTVQNTGGDKIGTIHDIVLSGTNDRHVLYVVLAHGGTLGMGEKLFAVPWSALQIQLKDQNKVQLVTINVSKADLDKAQGFDKKNWPTQPDTTLFKTEMAQNMPAHKIMLGRETGGEQMGWIKVSELQGMKVRNEQNQSLGDIESVILSGHHNHAWVEFGIVSYGGVLGVGEKYAAVPWKALELRSDEKIFVLNADKNRLESESFAMKDWPDFSNQTYVSKIYELYNIQPGMHARETAVSFDVWKEGSDYNKKFDTGKLTTFEGVVQNVGNFYIESGAAPGLRIRLQTDNGQSLIVQAGPLAYAESKNFVLSSGDRITVTGSQVEMNGRTVLVAGEIKKGNETFTLYDKSGHVLWDVNQLQTFNTHMQPANEEK